jgi:CRISPR-associated protein Cas2
MPHLLIYDITHPKRLRRVAQICEDFGVRLQDSVFECALDAEQLQRLRLRLLREIDVAEDSVRYIPVCARDAAARVVQYPPDAAPPSSSPPGHWIV